MEQSNKYSNGPGNVPRLPGRVVDTLIDSAGVSRCAPGRGIAVIDQTAAAEALVHGVCEELLARLPCAQPVAPVVDAAELGKLKARAESATPGDWYVHPITDDDLYPRGLAITAANGKTISDEDTGPGDADAEYIAAANPAAILRIAALVAQQAELIEQQSTDLAAYERICQSKDVFVAQQAARIEELAGALQEAIWTIEGTDNPGDSFLKRLRAIQEGK